MGEMIPIDTHSNLLTFKVHNKNIENIGDFTALKGKEEFLLTVYVQQQEDNNHKPHERAAP